MGKWICSYNMNGLNMSFNNLMYCEWNDASYLYPSFVFE